MLSRLNIAGRAHHGDPAHKRPAVNRRHHGLPAPNAFVTMILARRMWNTKHSLYASQLVLRDTNNLYVTCRHPFLLLYNVGVYYFLAYALRQKPHYAFQDDARRRPRWQQSSTANQVIEQQQAESG